ncbi:hypothetical protein [Salinisphaera shabanensis]|nr:hypothetical protein [Salinisphaera shabanensis]
MNEHEVQLRAAHDLVSKLYSQSASYTNLIMVAGYAGVIAFWSSLVHRLPQVIFFLAGALIISSLVIFIVWELFKMISSNLAIRRIQSSIEGAQAGPETMQRFQAAIQESSATGAKLWPWFMIPAVITGVGGGLVLLSYFVFRLVEQAI